MRIHPGGKLRKLLAAPRDEAYSLAIIHHLQFFNFDCHMDCS
eukprot:SAG31_NODE_4741_length_2988_cov_1.101419_4_plen_42_part_00